MLRSPFDIYGAPVTLNDCRRSLRRHFRDLLPVRLLQRPPRQHVFQEPPRVARAHFADILGRALRHDLAAAVTAFGTHVDDPIGGLDDFEIVLDHHHRIALLDEFVQHFEQLRHVVKM